LLSLPQEAADTAGGSRLVCTAEPNTCRDSTKISPKGAPYRCAVQRGSCFSRVIALPTALSLEEYVTHDQVWHPSISQIRVERMSLNQS